MEIFLLRVLFSVIFVQGFVAQQLPGEALMYPRRSEVTVDAGTDLTLGCRGVESMHWTFHDDVNGKHFNTSRKNITHMHNDTEPEYKFETLLTVYNVSRVNVGFYYCHGENVFFDTARRSSRIYVFVNDDNHLSVINSGESNFVVYYQTFSFPCRPTSQDINITLSCEGDGAISIGMSVNPANYTMKHQDENSVIIFHPYRGFAVELIQYRSIGICSCTFAKKDINFQMYLDRRYSGSFYLSNRLSIEGPATVDVGDDITLKCTSLLHQYFPYKKYWLLWNTSTSGHNFTENFQVIKLKAYVLLINILTMKNISTEYEGNYECRMKYYRTTFIKSKYVFVNDKKSYYSAPRIISPNGGEIQINSGGNISLRCVGSRSITWAGSNQVITEHVTNGLHEARLHITAASYTDTGLYECYERDSVLNHPLKSARFYIFVKDEHNLYVPYEKDEYKDEDDYKDEATEVFVDPYSNVTVPCLPTSRDVNVFLSMVYQAYDSINRRFNPAHRITPVIYTFDAREGVTVQMPGPGWLIATCTFGTATRYQKLDIEYSIRGTTFESEPFLTGPAEDLVFVGQTLELSCSVAVYHNVPDDALHWTLPNHNISEEVITKIERVNFFEGKVLISKLISNDVKHTNAGQYICHLASNKATAGKAISVHDPFTLKRFVEDSQYDAAYIGLPLVLRCKVNITHNIIYRMSWTTPNDTEIHVKNMDMVYMPNVRDIYSESILKIDNISNENAGNYTCTVYYSSNRKNYTTRNILVKSGQKPRIIMSNFKKHAYIGIQIDETVNLTCLAEGDPQPVITWIKGSNEVQRIGEHIGFGNNNSELTVHYVLRFDEGLYTCVAQNPFGRDSRAVNLHVKTASYTSYIVGSVVFLIVLLAATVAFFARRSYKQKKFRRELIDAAVINFQNGQIERLNALLNLGDQASNLPYDYRWEIPRSSIELGRNLGSGYFGLVVEATVSNYFDGEPEKTVAVKMLHRSCNFIELNSLICELKIMAHLGEHANLINLLGASTANIAEGNLLVVIEYCANGCLRNYLIENRSNFINLIDPETEFISLPADYNDSMQVALVGCGVSTLQLLRWALQVARGMEFLAARQVLHGDLALRNILLDENYVAKISDFGLSKTLNSSGYYKKKSQCPLPIKWMAIESIRDKTFSTQSDVWAFGVVVWELFSLARTPYAELEPDFRFYRKLESGYRLERPHYSTKEIYQVMRECWCAQPQCRPTFPCLVSTLTDLLQEPNKRCSAASQRESVEESSAVSRADDAAVTDWIALDILPSTSRDQDVFLTQL